jgi:N-acetylglucosaminyldiphosphoundecaprenol N-acetyl-beta-D-mannosaminyltransferase
VSRRRHRCHVQAVRWHVTLPTSESECESSAAFVVGGVRIDALQMDAAVQRVIDVEGPQAVHLCNAYTISLAARDPRYRSTLNAGHLNLADGTPVAFIARRLGFQEMTRRVYGPDLMQEALDRGRAAGARHYLYGSTEAVLRGMVERINARWPGVEVVGVESPSFVAITDSELAASIEKMDAAGASTVWVGMGTPKQDEIVARMAALGTHTYVAVGAAFDFIAGTKRQAPRWIREHGLEWLFRLVSEPRRLWRRYILGNARFLWCVTRSRPTRVPLGAAK